MRKITVISALVGCIALGAPHTFAQSLYQYQSQYSGLSTSVCTNLTKELSYGSRGSEVTRLQSFLVNRNYPGSGDWMITGYFGAATRAAVRNFQQERGLSQTGAADAATRAAIYTVSCGGSYGFSNPSQYPYLYTNYVNQIPYTYGYNNTATGCGVYNSYSYSYQNCGTYSGAYTAPTILFLNPQSGAVGDSVTVFGSGFTATGNTVRFGKGIIASINSTDGRTLSFTVPTQLTGYGSQVVTLGAYPVAVTNGAGYTTSAIPFNVTSLGTTGTPSISNVSGPTSIAAGTSGVWTVKVYNPGSNYLSVNVNWGDQNVYPYASAQAAQAIYTQGAQTLTFSHVYATGGTYTITFTITNANGASSVATATVYVSGSSNTGGTLSITSLSPTSGPVGSTVTIYGTGFSSWGNTVRFGNGAITNVSSTGSSITFTVPAYLSPYCVNGVVCPMYAQVVTPGVYPVSVINASGNTSNVNTFTVQ